MEETTLNRVAPEDVPRNKVWELAAVWELEVGQVVEWLRTKANANVGRLPSNEAVLKAGEGLSEEVLARFGAEAPSVDPDILDKAAKGVLGREAPSAKLITASSILKWTAFFSETILFVILQIMGFGNPILILMGVLLALSGYATGYGAGAVLTSHEDGYGMKNLKGWLFLIFGALGAVTISWLRSQGAEEGQAAAVLIPIILVVAIALFEALDLTLSHKYDSLRDQMYKAQAWYASEQHRKNFDSGLWKTIYEREIQGFATKRNDALQAKGPHHIAAVE
jgi:hypothetical protein